MNRILKRALSCILVLAMIVSAAPVAIAAEKDKLDESADEVVSLSATSISLEKSDTEQTVNVYLYMDKNAQIGSLSIEYALSKENDNVKLGTGIPGTGLSGAASSEAMNVSNGGGAYMDYDPNVDGYIICCIPVTIASNAEGAYTINFSNIELTDADNGDGYNLASDSVTATITVTEPAAPAAEYEIYYTLDSEKTDDDGDNYKDYDIGDQVTAEIFLVSNNADVTLQAYDIYLTYDPDGLSYNSLGADMAGTAYKTVDEDNKVEAEKGDTVTHIQLVADNNECVELEKEEATSLGTIVFDIADGVKYGQELEITLTNGTTNISLALTDTAATQGDKNAYYPIVTGDDLGAEVTTTYTVTYSANGGIGAPEEQTKEYNKDLTLSATKPTRDGYTFKGWTTVENPALDADAEYQAGGTYSANKDVTLYAVWQQDSFDVTWYNADGEEIYTESVDSGSEASFDADSYAVPTKEADAQYTYTFIGWNTTENATEALDKLTVTEDTKFYPVFTSELNKYTVTWYNQDGSAPALETDENVEYGTAPSYDSDEPTKAADAQYTYAFAGWATTANQESGTAEEDLPTVSGNTNYYAAFSKTVNSYKVTFNTPQGTAPAEQTVEYGNKANKPEDLTAEHYTFDGWYTDDTYATAYDFENTTITGDTTLYAKWTPKTYTVTFNANGGSGEMKSQSFTYGVAQALTANGFTAPTGKTFDGWKDGEGTTYTDKQSISLTDNITLYAQWSSNNYTVSADANVQNGTVKPEKGSANYGDIITVNVNPADGYEIDTVTYTPENGEAVTVYAVDGTYSFTMPDSNVTVSATFKAIDYTVTIGTITNGSVVASKSTANVGDEITLTASPNRGYKLKEYTVTYGDGQTATVTDGKFNMPAADVTVTAEFEAISYTIAFDGNDATSGSMNPITDAKYGVEQKLTNNSFTKNGYKFLGWSDDKDATTVTYTDGATVSNLTTTDGATVTLYAIWGEDTFDVTLNTNGGTINSGNVTEYTYGTGATLPTDVTKTGYDFDGWYNNENLTGEAVTTIGKEEYDAKEYWAKWTPAEYNIILKPGDGASYDEDVTVPDSYVYGVGTELPTPTKPGYEFAGWLDENGDEVTEITDEDFGNKELTAQWTAIPYTITLNPNGGEVSTEGWTKGDDGNYTMTYTIDKPVTLPTPTKQYYSFKGWSVESEAGNWEVGTYNATEYSGKYGNVTLTAQWNRAATPVVEQYKYACDGYWMLRVDASNVAEGQEYQFNDESMYYTIDPNYLVDADDSGVFYTLIPEKYVDTANNALTDEGYNLLKIAACNARSTIKYDGDINGDDVVNIADANTVYQMTVYGGSYYTETQLDTVARLKADMDKAVTAGSGDHRGSIADVNVIVNMINGIAN